MPITTDITRSKATEPHLQKFERFERERQVKQPAWVFPLRKAAISRFAELGFPTLKNEDWRFTNVAPIAKLPFKPLFSASPNGIDAAQIDKFIFGKLPSHRLVFLNGHFIPKLSTPGSLPKGVVVKDLASALGDDADLLQRHLGH